MECSKIEELNNMKSVVSSYRHIEMDSPVLLVVAGKQKCTHFLYESGCLFFCPSQNNSSHDISISVWTRTMLFETQITSVTPMIYLCLLIINLLLIFQHTGKKLEIEGYPIIFGYYEKSVLKMAGKHWSIALKFLCGSLVGLSGHM